jgi:hypothetical protein
MLKHKLLLASSIIVLSITSFVYAFVGPLWGKAKLLYIEDIKSKDISELEKILENDTDFESNKGELVLEELGNRADKKSQALLERYGQKLKNEIDAASGRSFYIMAYNNVLINLAKIKAGGQDSNQYVDDLEKLLTSKDQYLQQGIVLSELSNTLTPKARDVLLKYENATGINTSVRFYRLRMDYLNLDDEAYIKAILKSAREQIAKGDTLLLVELNILGERISQPLPSLILEEEIKNPTLENQVYRKFLSDIYERVQRSENSSFPGFSELWSRYKKRDSSVFADLEKIYLDDSYTKYGETYREKTCEMCITMRLEQQGLTNPQDAAKYLLSQLKGTGDGHLSDYTEQQNAPKTLQAIEDAARVKLIIRCGDSILPSINEQLSKEQEGQRREALNYIIKQLELTEQ